VAVVGCFTGSVEDYQAHHAAWVLEVRPERCPHCGAEHTCIFWGSYARWVRLTTHRVSIRIERVRCTVCHVTDALLPSFLHMFRHYALFLIQKAVTLAVDAGLWGDELADAVGPFNQPAPSTIREWVWFFALSLNFAPYESNREQSRQASADRSASGGNMRCQSAPPRWCAPCS